MNIIVLGLVVAAALLAVGVLIGSGLHGRAVDQKYRRLAHLVRELNELQEAPSGRGHSREIRGGRAPDVSTLVPQARQHDPLLGRGSALRAANGNPARGGATATDLR